MNKYKPTFLNLITLIGIVVGICFSAVAENKLSDEWNAVSAKKDTYFQDKDHKIEGKYSEKFILKHGDCGQYSGYNDCINDRGRIEKQQKFIHGKEHWYKFSFFIDQSWPTKYAYSTTISQSKTMNTRPGVWYLKLEYGDLTLEFPMIDQRCDVLATFEDLVNKWTEVVLYTNLSDKTTEWIDNPKKKAAVWINGERKKLYCGYSIDEYGLIPKVYQNDFRKDGTSFKYGMYHYYVSNDLAKLNPNIELPGWVDGDASGKGQNAKSKTNDPWSIDWPIKYPNKTIWWDNLEHKVSGKNVFNMDLSNP